MDIVDIISQSNESLMEEYEKISDDLALLGLSDYEARAYIALVAHGVADAETIATTAQIPRTSAYKILDTLEEKGFAHAGHGRPRMYRPEDPAKVGGQIISRLENTFGKLEMIKEILKEQGMPQLIYTITGKDRVLDKISHMLDKATETFMMSTPNMAELRLKLEKKAASAMKRGVQVTILTGHGQKVPKGVDVRRKDGLIATDVIVDSTSALIASPDLENCGFTDNEYLASHLENFLWIAVDSTKRQKP
ncbi:MAG: TrmB family transcriptional regulator [Thermoplasmata archaeon]|nr:TrmB family transcriptional regulator [Thermoplasmata archaeon]